MVGWYAMRTTVVLLGTQYWIRRLSGASRCLLADGIHCPDAACTRISAHLVNLLWVFEPRRFKAAALDVIEELSRVIRIGPTLYVVIYGSKRTYLAAKLIAADLLANHVRLSLAERELTCSLLTIPRIFLYQVDTDRYPFTDRL